MRQGKGAAGPSTPGGAGTAKNPKTPGTSGTGGGVRKRSAASTKTPASKKAKTAVKVEVIDDDSSKGGGDAQHVPATNAYKAGANSEAPHAAYQARNNYTNAAAAAAAPEAAPSLASAQAASPDESETNVTTPTNAAASSFSNNGGSQGYGGPAYSFSGPAAGERYQPGPFYNPAYGFSGPALKDEADEEDYEI